MPSSQGQAHTITGGQVDAALVALRELVNLQKGQVGSVSPHAEVSGAFGNRSKKCAVAPVVAASESSIDGSPQADFPQVLSLRRSVLWRSLGIIAQGLIVFVIVGTALAWRSGDTNTREVIKAWGSSLARLSFADAIKSHDAIEPSPNANAAPAEPTSNHPDQGSAQKDVVMPAASVTPSAAAPDEVSSELRQQLATISADLAALQRTLEQLAAAQNRMAQDIKTLQTAQKTVDQKISSLKLTPRTPRSKSTSSETVVEPNSQTVTTASPRPPLELH
jgi:hypothetical protein